MSWILLCLLWVTLTKTSAYNYRDYPHAFNDYPHERVQPRRVDYKPTHLDYSSYHKRLQRSAERINLEPNRTNESPSHRINERSIAVRLENNSSDSVLRSRRFAKRFVPEIPNECKNLSICETVPNYPQRLADNIISKLERSGKLDRFKVEELEDPESVERIGPDDNAMIDLCPYKERVVTPQAGKDGQGNWHFILNSIDDPLQGYRVKICRLSDHSCGENIASFSPEYTSMCKQEFVQRTMTTLDMHGSEVTNEVAIKVPSCCSCVAVSNYKYDL